MSHPLAPIDTSHAPPDAVSLLARAAKQGKLPGFEAGASPSACSVEAFGTVFDHRIHIEFSPVSTGGSRATLTLVRPFKKPAIFLAVMLICIWPGYPMTDSMLRTWWGWYDTLPSWATIAWYLPLTILPMPFVWVKWTRESHAAAVAHSQEQRVAIEAILAPKITP
jgi:hypothetical protein